MHIVSSVSALPIFRAIINDLSPEYWTFSAALHEFWAGSETHWETKFISIQQRRTERNNKIIQKWMKNMMLAFSSFICLFLKLKIPIRKEIFEMQLLISH